MRIRDGKKSEPGSGMEKIRNWDPGWKKFRTGNQDGKNSEPGTRVEKIRIRDPGSATQHNSWKHTTNCLVIKVL
jgi:hypothetical protein